MVGRGSNSFGIWVEVSVQISVWAFVFELSWWRLSPCSFVSSRCTIRGDSYLHLCSAGLCLWLDPCSFGVSFLNCLLTSLFSFVQLGYILWPIAYLFIAILFWCRLCVYECDKKRGYGFGSLPLFSLYYCKSWLMILAMLDKMRLVCFL